MDDNRQPRPAQIAWTRRLEHMEPAAGFGSRIGALNRMRLRPFLSEMRISARDIDKGVESAIRALAVVGHADPDLLVRYSPIPAATRGGLARVAGETLDALQTNRTFFRYCPHCIAQDLASFDGPQHTKPWLRLAWIVGHFRTCPIHCTPLLMAQPIRRRYEPFDFCETIALQVLPSLDAALAAAQDTALSPFQQWVTARLEGGRDPANWLDTMDLHAATGFAEAIGISILHPSKVKMSEVSEMDRAVAADAGFRVLFSGPHGLRDALSSLTAAEAQRRGYWGLRDTYGHAYGLLQKTQEDAAYEPFREVVRAHALENVPIEPGTDVLGRKADTRKVHTVRTLAIESGAHARTIRRYFERKGLVGHRADTGITDHRATVAAEEMETIARELQGALSTPQVREEFAIPRVHLTKLIALGYLPAVTDSAERRYGKHRFTRQSVQEMLDRMFAGALDVTEHTGRQVPLLEARHIAGCTLDEAFEVAFGKKLAWKGLLGGRREYGALLLDADELTRIVRDKPKMTSLTRTELKNVIPGLGPNTTQFLVDMGHLTETKEYSPDARRVVPVIDAASAEAFRARYVTLGELLRRHKLHFKTAIPALTAAGVSPAFDAEEADCFLYDRRAAEAALDCTH